MSTERTTKLDEAQVQVARAARRMLGAVTRESTSREGETVSVTLPAAARRALREAVAAYDDAAHEAVTGGAR